MQGISILICCYNSEKIIAQNLAHLQRQIVDEVKWEIVLVDNNSSDQTAKTAEASWNYDLNPNLRIVKEEKPGLSNARLKAIKESKYDLISFVDDDNLVPENWVQYLSDTFKDSDVGVLGCTSIGKFNYQTPSWYEKHKLSFATGALYPAAFSDVTQDGLVYGAGMTMRKEIFSKLFQNGWEPFLTDRVGTKQSGGGDSELTLAARLIGYKIYYSNEVKTQHLIAANRLTWERLKAMTQGFGEADVFMLPYQYQYKKLNGNTTFLDELRKFWWVNYIGKKINLTKHRISKKAGRLSKDDFEIIEIRYKAFCQSIKQEKRRFSASFKKLEQLNN